MPTVRRPPPSKVSQFNPRLCLQELPVAGLRALSARLPLACDCEGGGKALVLLVGAERWPLRWLDVQPAGRGLQLGLWAGRWIAKVEVELDEVEAVLLRWSREYASILA